MLFETPEYYISFPSVNVLEHRERFVQVCAAKFILKLCTLMLAVISVFFSLTDNSFVAWSRTRPLPGRAHCVAMAQQGQYEWLPNPCAYPYGYICQFGKGA